MHRLCQCIIAPAVRGSPATYTSTYGQLSCDRLRSFGQVGRIPIIICVIKYMMMMLGWASVVDAISLLNSILAVLRFIRESMLFKSCIPFTTLHWTRFYATGSADAIVGIWDANELICARTVSRMEWHIRTLSFSYDGQLLAIGSEDPVIDIV